VDNENFSRLSRKAFFLQQERERQKWLIAGMSEAGIFHAHREDYFVWLSEKAYNRTDHKYMPGGTLSLETVLASGVRIRESTNYISDAEVLMDFEAALDYLTDLQRHCFVEVRLNRKTQAEVSENLGVSRESVKQAIAGAIKKLKKYFS
jgi:RNA polymerase sigma factor (sigma-70 family)